MEYFFFSFISSSEILLLFDLIDILEISFSPEFCEVYWLLVLVLFIFSFEILISFDELVKLLFVFKSSGTTIN
jgi:hypothetical protein